jgi:hypothetical protein
VPNGSHDPVARTVHERACRPYGEVLQSLRTTRAEETTRLKL